MTTASMQSPSLPPSFAFSLLDQVQECMVCWTEEGHGIYCNKASLDFFSLPHVAAFQENSSKLFAQLTSDNVSTLEDFQQCLQKVSTEGIYKNTFTFQSLQGTPLPCHITLTAMEDDGKKYIVCRMYCREAPVRAITTSNIATPQDDICTSETLARYIMNASILPTALWNENLEVIDCTAKRLQSSNAVDKGLTESFFSLWPEFQPNGQSSHELGQIYLQKTLENGYCHFTWAYSQPDGSILEAEVLLVRVCLLNKNYLFSYTFKESINDTPTLNIINSFDRMQVLLKHLPIGIDLWNKDFEIFDCNEATLHLFGVKDKEDYVKNFKNFTPELQPCGTPSAELIPQHLQKVFENGHNTFEWMHVTASGEALPMEVSVIRTQHAGEDVAVVYYKDLREVKKNMERVQKAEQHVKDILNAAPYAINTWSKNFVPIGCNDATLYMYGFDSKQEYLENFKKVIPEYQRDGRKMSDVLVQRFSEAFTTGYSFDSGELINVKTGELFPVEITLKKLILDNEERVITYMTDLSLQDKMMQEIQASHKELSVARDLAEKSSRIKGEFLANMSHEIRTPMNGILGLLHLLSLTTLQEQQKFYVDKILYSAQSLMRIINDILDFSKMEAGKMDMENVSFSLEDIQEELRTLFAPKFDEKNLHGCIFDENVLDTKLMGDPLRLKQVLLNLVSNAIKFTESGSVSVSIENVTQDKATEICYHFSVQDTGIGLSEEQCSRIFEAFSQADASTTRKYGGTGLGLIICKRIIEMMQGKIWVESTLGKGSKFHFTAVFGIDSSSLATNILDKNIDTKIQSSTTQGSILLVEDNEINQIIAKELIESQGHKVDVADNGQIAIEMIEKNYYDMVFMDIQMPIMDGLTAVRTLRKNPKYTHLPVIAMSAHAMAGDKEISLSNGMNDHLSKPIQTEKLYESINFWLHNIRH